MLTFVPEEAGALDGAWQVGRPYALKLYFFTFLPMGRHVIQLAKVDRAQNVISSRESGLLLTVWNHDIFFEEVAPGVLSYTDEIEIRAGVLTPFIWLFAHVFYRHRQRRWKVLLRESAKAG